MKQLNLRIATVTLCAMTVFAAVCHAQLDAISTAPGTKGAASGQETGSSIDGERSTSADGTQGANAEGTQPTTPYGAQPVTADADQPVTAVETGASTWTAGESSFKQSSDASWGGKQADFGTAGAKDWTAESASFAEHVQPGGIWREKAPPLPVVMPSAIASLPASSLVIRPGGARRRVSGGRKSRSAYRGAARHQFGAPLTGRTQDTTNPAQGATGFTHHHLGAESGDDSKVFTPGAGATPQ